MIVCDHTAEWADGLRVQRIMKHRAQLCIKIEYAGVVHEVWLGKRTFKAILCKPVKCGPLVG